MLSSNSTQADPKNYLSGGILPAKPLQVHRDFAIYILHTKNDKNDILQFGNLQH